MPDLILKGITKKFDDVTAVNSISYKITDGEFVALLGPSGCGKTTTLLMIAGIYRPTEGDIIFGDEVVTDLHPKDRDIGMVFQSYALYPGMNVFDNISFPLKLKKVSKDKIDKKVKEITSLLEIPQLLNRKPSQLSGGQQQRVALARALVKEPKYLLLDEPLSNLDAKLRMSMRTEIKKIQRELGITTILVTHDQEEAMSMADRIILMERGEIQQVGDHSDLYYHPKNIFIASFIGSPAMNFYEVRTIRRKEILYVTKNDIELCLENIVLDKDLALDNLTLGIRPEHIFEDESNYFILGEIISIEPLGREVLVVAKTAIGIVHFLVDVKYKKEIGDTVKLAVEKANIQLFNDKGYSVLKEG